MANDPFFIGWESQPAPPLSRFLRKTTAIVAVLALALGAVIALTSMRTVGNGQFDFGNVQTFSGVLVEDPVPLLLTDEPLSGHQMFFLVNPFKHGFPPETAKQYHLKHVDLQATLIHDDVGAMLEVLPDSVKPKTGATAPATDPRSAQSEGRPVTMRGEIVDSKCHLGVMNPGRYKAHRACAIRCLAGGIPPLLITTDPESDQALQFVLVGPGGEAVNELILDHVAEPIEVQGVLKEQGGLSILFMDPTSLKRL